jgi:hypothetical protein
VGVRGVALEELLHVLVDQRVTRDLAGEVGPLLLVRELPVDQQVGDLEERGALGQLFDRVAAVLEDPLVTVDEGDRAAAGAGVAVRGVVGDCSGGGTKCGDVDAALSSVPVVIASSSSRPSRTNRALSQDQFPFVGFSGFACIAAGLRDNFG